MKVAGGTRVIRVRRYTTDLLCFIQIVSDVGGRS